MTGILRAPHYNRGGLARSADDGAQCVSRIFPRRRLPSFASDVGLFVTRVCAASPFFAPPEELKGIGPRRPSGVT